MASQRILFKLIGMAGIFLLLLSFVPSVLAQTPVGTKEAAPTPTETPVPDEAASAEETSAAEETPVPEEVLVAEGATVVDVALSDLGINDVVLRGDADHVNYYPYMPRNFELRQESYVEIFFSYYVLGGTIPANLEVLLNGDLLGAASLSPEEVATSAARRSVRLPLGEAGLFPGGNRLRIRLDTFEVCDVYEPEVKVTIFADSYLHLVYDEPPLELDLREYPYPFYERMFRPSEVTIVLPEDPLASELSAAATISAGLGRLAGSASNVVITSLLDVDVTSQISQNHNLILIGQGGRNRLARDIDLPANVQASDVEADDGVLQLVASPWNSARAVLVVGGQSDLALYRASAALNRPANLPGLRTQVSIVKDVLPPPFAAMAQTAVDKTFADLGYDDEYVNGITRTWIRYHFDLPRTWERLEAPRLVLSFSHSSIIDPENSAIDVYLNNTPIGGTLLDEDNQANGMLELEVPAWLLEPGRNRVEVWVEMHLFDEHCLPGSDPRAWTVIFKNSYLHLPLMGGEEGLDLAFFPSPFNTKGNYEETVLVVPEAMTAEQRGALLRLAASLGASSTGDYLALQLVYDTQVTDEVRAEKHLIVIGRPSLNALLQEEAVAGALPQPFEPGTDVLLPKHDTIIVRQLPGWGIGLLQEFPSPWNSERAVLAVTGTIDESIVWGLEALRFASGALQGDLVVVDEGGIRQAIWTRDEYTQAVLQPSGKVAPVGADKQRLLSLSEKWW